MDLTDREISLIRQSFARLKAENNTVRPFGDAFYARVFAHMPEARSLFRADMAGQGMQFLSTLHVVVDHLDDLDRIDRELRTLGEGHAAFGVRPEHYAPMGEALIETMRAAFGETFDPETEAAWRRAYTGLSRRMVAAGLPGEAERVTP